MAIAIIHIGFTLDPKIDDGEDLLTKLNVELSENKGEDVYEQLYELTHLGEVLNLNEYAAWITDTREIRKEEIEQEKEELKLTEE